MPPRHHAARARVRLERSRHRSRRASANRSSRRQWRHTRHVAFHENARGFFNETSTQAAQDFIKAKEALTRAPPVACKPNCAQQQRRGSMRVGTTSPPPNARSTAMHRRFPVMRWCFVLRDQTFAAAMPRAHDVWRDLAANPLRGPGVLCYLSRRSAREARCRGPDLEDECARRVRRVCIRWRDCAGSILSSGVRRRKPTNR